MTSTIVPSRKERYISSLITKVTASWKEVESTGSSTTVYEERNMREVSPGWGERVCFEERRPTILAVIV